MCGHARAEKEPGEADTLGTDAGGEVAGHADKSQKPTGPNKKRSEL